MKKPQAFVGKKNNGAARTYIAIGGAIEGDWMTPREARRLATQLIGLAYIDTPAWREKKLAQQKAAMLRRQKRKGKVSGA